MDKGDDPYKILGVSLDANDNDIKKSYRKLALKNHPDKGGNPKTFSKISNAYEILSDEEERKNYDLQQQHGVCQGYDPDGPRFTTTGSYSKDDLSPPSSPNNAKTTSSRTFTMRSPGGKKGSTTTSYTTHTATTSIPQTRTTTTTRMSTTGGIGTDGSKSRFHDPYEIFKQHFGSNMADDLFNDKDDTLDDNDIIGMSQAIKTKNGQKVVETTYTRKDGSSFTKVESNGSNSTTPSSKARSSKKTPTTSSVFPIMSTTTTIRSSSSSPRKAPKSKITSGMKSLSLSPKKKSNTTRSNRQSQDPYVPDDVTSMSESTKTICENGETLYVTETTYTKSDGSTFTQTTTSPSPPM